jgi:hypothetical protein
MMRGPMRCRMAVHASEKEGALVFNAGRSDTRIAAKQTRRFRVDKGDA